MHQIPIAPWDLRAIDRGAFVTSRYVDRALAADEAAPMVFEMDVTPSSDVVSAVRWRRLLERGEKAIYETERTEGATLADPVGDDVALTDLAGSALLAAFWGKGDPSCVVSDGARERRRAPGRLTLRLTPARARGTRGPRSRRRAATGWGSRAAAG